MDVAALGQHSMISSQIFFPSSPPSQSISAYYDKVYETVPVAEYPNPVMQSSALALRQHVIASPCSIITFRIFLLLVIFRGLQSEQEVLLTHGDSIDRVASSLKVIAKSGDLVAGTV